MITAVYPFFEFLNQLKTHYSIPVVYDPELSYDSAIFSYRLLNWLNNPQISPIYDGKILAVSREPLSLTEELKFRGIYPKERFQVVSPSDSNTQVEPLLGQIEFSLTVFSESLRIIEEFEWEFNMNYGLHPIKFDASITPLSIIQTYYVYWDTNPDSLETSIEDTYYKGISFRGRIVGLFYKVLDSPRNIIEEIRFMNMLENKLNVIT